MHSNNILLILPCNPGAKEGNYFPQGAWKQAMNVLNKYKINKSLVDFAAVDSIITKLDPCKDRDEKGAIVHENEMFRVKGCDLYPRWKIFSDDNYSFLKEHTKYCEISLKKFIPAYKLIVVAVEIRGYKYAVIRALRNLGDNKMPNNTVVIDAGESQPFENNAISLSVTLIRDFLNTKVIPQGKIVKPKKLIGNERFLIRPQNLPADFVYWNLPYYIPE